MRIQTVSTAAELLHASEEDRVSEIRVTTDLDGLQGFSLMPGQSLCGLGRDGVSITFRSGTDGVSLSTDNAVCPLQISVSPDKRAIWNSYSVPDLGTLRVKDVPAIGQVQILARANIRAGPVEVLGLRILAADTRSAIDAPTNAASPYCRVHSPFGICSQTAMSVSQQIWSVFRLVKAEHPCLVAVSL